VPRAQADRTGLKFAALAADLHFMSEHHSSEETPGQGRLVRWLDPGPEPSPTSGALAPLAVPLSEATSSAVDQLAPLRIAGRW